MNTLRTAIPGALAAPRLTARHPGCAEQALPPLQGCSREQQSKTNSQTQQTYFFDSLNIKKGKKKKANKCSTKQSALSTALRMGIPCLAGGALGVLVLRGPGCVVAPQQAWLPGGLTPGPCPSQRDMGLRPDKGAWNSSPCWVLAGGGGGRQGSEERVH